MTTATPADTATAAARPMPSLSPTAVADVLNGLLEAELSSLFRTIEQSSPYIGRATADVRSDVRAMADASRLHAAELSAAIESLGMQPVPVRHLRPDEQYLAYLSLKFLLPKLVGEKDLLIQRYDNAIRALRGAPKEILDLLARHLTDHRAHRQVLERAAAEAAKAT